MTKKVTLLFLVCASIGLANAGKTELAIIDFFNETKGSSYGYLSASLADSLKKEMAKVIRFKRARVDPELVAKFLKSSEAATNEALMLFSHTVGVQYVAFGSYQVVGKNKIKLIAKVFGANENRVIVTTQLIAKTDKRLFEKTNALARDLATKLLEYARAHRDRSLVPGVSPKVAVHGFGDDTCDQVKAIIEQSEYFTKHQNSVIELLKPYYTKARLKRFPKGQYVCAVLAGDPWDDPRSKGPIEIEFGVGKYESDPFGMVTSAKIRCNAHSYYACTVYPPGVPKARECSGLMHEKIVKLMKLSKKQRQVDCGE